MPGQRSDAAEDETLFDALCAYESGRRLYPEVVINRNVLPLAEQSGTRGDAGPAAALSSYEAGPSALTFQDLFGAITALDSTEPATVTIVPGKGLLVVGASFYQPPQLVPGEYPFRGLRALPMSAAELDAYEQVPEIDFGPGPVQVVTSQLSQETPAEWAGVNNRGAGQYGLISTKVTNPSALAAALTDALERAQSQAAGIVMFPELSVDAAGLDVISGWISDQLEAKAHVPQLVVGGSFYVKEVDGTYRNRCTSFVTGSDGVVRRVQYDKRVPFSAALPAQPPANPEKGTYDSVVAEAIEAGCSVLVEAMTSQNAVTVLNTSIGLVGLAICRDVLDLAGVGNPLERYLDVVDHILVISMNAGVTWLFQSQGEDLARWHNASVTYVNAAQSLTPSQYAEDTNCVMSFSTEPWNQVANGASGVFFYPDIVGLVSTSSFNYEVVPKDGITGFTLGQSAAESD